MSIISRSPFGVTVQRAPAAGLHGVVTDPRTGAAFLVPDAHLGQVHDAATAAGLGHVRQLVPCAATAGALMANTYTLGMAMPSGSPFVTAQSFGPLTNANVLAVQSQAVPWAPGPASWTRCPSMPYAPYAPYAPVPPAPVPPAPVPARAFDPAVDCGGRLSDVTCLGKTMKLSASGEPFLCTSAENMDVVRDALLTACPVRSELTGAMQYLRDLCTKCRN